jgi:hypothetical protein
MPQTPEVASAVFKASQVPENYADKWISRALYVAAMRQGDAFVAASKGQVGSFASLPSGLRLPANTWPDWRAPSAADLAANWKDIQVPGSFESRAIPDFDGVYWYTRTFNVAAPAAGTIQLGRIQGGQGAAIWVNGQLVTPPPGLGRGAGGGGGGRGRGNATNSYPLTQQQVRTGTNVVTVRISNNRNESGLTGSPDQLFVQVGEARTLLAGPGSTESNARSIRGRRGCTNRLRGWRLTWRSSARAGERRACRPAPRCRYPEGPRRRR